MTNSDRTPQETTHRVDSKHDVSASRGRKKVERRRHIDPTTCERDYDADEVMRSLGYRQVAAPSEITL